MMYDHFNRKDFRMRQPLFTITTIESAQYSHYLSFLSKLTQQKDSFVGQFHS